MSVLIKTITNLPDHCYDCPCHDGESGYCQADKEHRYSDYRPFWCPLVEISTAVEEITGKGKMTRLDKTVSDVGFILDNLILLRQIQSTGDCNSCVNKDCEYEPKAGQMVRYNCPFYKIKSEVKNE